MTRDVFISYAARDKDIADRVVASLEGDQVSCWYAPRNIEPGADWGQTIVSAIEECKVFLLIFSSNTDRSQRVLNELEFANVQQVEIIPLRTEDLEPEGALKFHLSMRHWLDINDPAWDTHIKEMVLK